MAKKQIEQYGKYTLTKEKVLDTPSELSLLEIFHCTEKKLKVEILDESGESKWEERLVTLDGLDNDLVMRYIIMMYAKGSEYVENYPKIGKRKTKVLEKLGIMADSENKFEKNLSNMLIGKNRLVQQKLQPFLPCNNLPIGLLW